MADLQLLYKEYGIGGIAPYAFTRNNEAYLRLIHHLKNDDSFYLAVSSVTGVPILDVDAVCVKAFGFSSESKAEKFLADCATEGYPIQLNRVNGTDVFSIVQNQGAEVVVFDDTTNLHLVDIVGAPANEAVVDVDRPLKNYSLNAALAFTTQARDAGRDFSKYLAYIIQMLQERYFLIPVFSVAEGESVELTQKNLCVRMFVCDGVEQLAVFTDTESYADFCDKNGEQLHISIETPVMIISFNDVLRLVTSAKVPLVLNPGTVGLMITESELRGQNANPIDDKTESVPEDDDPVPDFLK